MIRIDEIWLATEPLDMRAGPDKALARVWRQLSCPVRDNYDGRLGGLTFYSFQPA